jgi:hypothetical protein
MMTAMKMTKSNKGIPKESPMKTITVAKSRPYDRTDATPRYSIGKIWIMQAN